MMKVFFDTNIMIDVIGRREEFCEPSMRIMSLAETRRILRHQPFQYLNHRSLLI